MGCGLLQPKLKIPGSYFAGRVEAVGRNTKQFRPGDEVFGDLSNCGRGGYAEYVCAPENVLAMKPASISFEKAAAVPETAEALQYYSEGHARGKVVITVDQNNNTSL